MAILDLNKEVGNFSGWGQCRDISSVNLKTYTMFRK
jgi:hypothetical protein